MSSSRFKSLAEQVANKIRDDLVSGRWTGVLPGRKTLAAELGVNHKTCDAALRLLENEGLIQTQAKGLGRAIVESALRDQLTPNLKVRVLLYEQSDAHAHFMVELLHRLRERGYEASFVGRTMKGLGMKKERIIRHVESVEADAWIILAGPSDLLHWFAAQPVPAFSLYRQMREVPMASILPNKQVAMDDLLERLVTYGHRRIQLITREDRRKPHPGAIEQGFLAALQALGIQTGQYNLPDWGDNPDELGTLLKSLFRHPSSRPTALIMSEALVFYSVLQQLAAMGLKAPADVSLACMDHSPLYDWSLPRATHFYWSTSPLISRMVRWVDNISLGKKDLRKTTIRAKLAVGGTIGPAPR